MTDSPAPPVLSLAGMRIALDRVQIMGILNVTPDSFYDQGRYRGRDAAVLRGIEMVDQGADLIDVGGEKAGPGNVVSTDEEISRVVPVIAELHRQVNVPISVDTFKAKVAGAAVSAGASLINSISGFVDPDLRDVAAQSGAGVIVMHINGLPRVANPDPQYSADVVGDVIDFLKLRVAACLDSGIAAERIVVDPGPGFGKTTAHDLAIMRGLNRLTALPFPVLLAVSHKKFIGDALGLSLTDRLEASLAALVWGILQGVKMVRVHDVQASVRVCRMTEAVLNHELLGEAPR